MAHRFLIEGDAVAGDRAVIAGAEAHHLRNVLRLRPGTAVELLDGHGTIHGAEIESTAADCVARITTTERIAPAVPELHLVQAMLKTDKMEFVLQKAVELGIRSFRPLLSERCETRRLDAHRLDRWRKIVGAACKQCGQAWLPDLAPLTTIGQLTVPDDSLKLAFWEEEKRSALASLLAPAPRCARIYLCVGPEGGFSPPDIAGLHGHGFVAASLGKLILRAETAALAALAVCRFASGQLG
ncbi:MAG: RsmE family RNA methyltransferase [Thermodesulfobacteriota bacterium]